MKLINTIFAFAAVSASIISCTRTLEPVREPQDFSAEAARLNGNVAAMQAVAQGQVINSVKAAGSVYDILLANGTQLKIDNRIGVNAPEAELKDGAWSIDGSVLTDARGEAVGLDVLPEFAVNAAGKWTVGAEGKETVLKTVVSGNADYFDAVECTENEFSLTTKSAARLSATVAAGFLFKIDASGVQNFVLGQTRSYAVTRNGISAATVVAPEGWEVKLSEAQISVTAPHAPVTKAVIADSKTDVSVIAVSTAGYVTIAKICTELDETMSATDPFATLATGAVKAFSAEVNVSLQNQTAWYWMLKKASETAPSADEIKAANTGSDTKLTLTTEPETAYTLYVLPVGETKDGAIAKISFTTAAVTSYYEAWEAGAEIKIGSQTYSKEKNGKAKLITGGVDQQIYGSWVNNGNFRAFFIDEGSSAFFNNAGYDYPVIVLGNIPGTRPVVTIKQQIAVNGTDLAFKNVSMKMADGMTGSKVIYSNTEMGRMILDDCYVDLKYPMLQRYNTDGSTAGKMAGVEILDCDVCVNWASGTPFILNTHAGGADCGDLIVRNNVFWSKGDKQEFHICAGLWIKDAKFNDVVLENNTFYNLYCGLSSYNSEKKVVMERARALIVSSTFNSFSMSGNIVYDTTPENKGVAPGAYFTWLYSTQMKLEDMKAATKFSISNLINIAEYCSLLATNDNGGADWNLGLNCLINWKDGRKEIESWINPFAVEKPEDGYFVTKDEYKAYGAQRK